MYTSRGETCVTECYPEEGYVIKRFRPRKPKYGRPINALRASLDLCLYREVECLTRLKGHAHFPQLLDYNTQELWVRMSWVGEHFQQCAEPDRQQYLDQVDTIVDTLESKNIQLAYEWTPGDGRIGYCLSMMLLKDGVLSLIDFERAWPQDCARESEFNQLFRNSFAQYDNKKFRQILQKTIITA
jgi:predicted Ser/Thr protein kinase